MSRRVLRGDPPLGMHKRRSHETAGFFYLLFVVLAGCGKGGDLLDKYIESGTGSIHRGENSLQRTLFCDKKHAVRRVSGFVTYVIRKGVRHEEVEIHAGDGAVRGYGHCLWNHRMWR